METRCVTRKGTIKFNGNEFVPDDSYILLRKIGFRGRVLIMEDAFPQAIIIHNQSKEFLCNAYIPGFFDHDHKGREG